MRWCQPLAMACTSGPMEALDSPYCATAVVRVKRHIDESPLNALRLAKRRRFEADDESQSEDMGVHKRSDSKPDLVTLTFAGTSYVADLEAVQNIIRCHKEGFAKLGKSTLLSTDPHRKIKILTDHRKLMDSQNQHKANAEGENCNSSEDIPECTLKNRISGDLNYQTSQVTKPNGLFTVIDALHKDLLSSLSEEKQSDCEASTTFAETACHKKTSRPLEHEELLEVCNTHMENQEDCTPQSISSVAAKDDEMASHASDGTESSTTDARFVYDIYYSEVTSANGDAQLAPDNLDYVLERCVTPEELLVFDADYRKMEDSFIFDEDDSDSNAEDNPRNDYPDEDEWYDARGRELEWGSNESLNMLEQYDEFGYIQRRLKTLDVDRESLDPSESE